MYMYIYTVLHRNKKNYTKDLVLTSSIDTSSDLEIAILSLSQLSTTYIMASVFE